jgi:hypothetical protein
MVVSVNAESAALDAIRSDQYLDASVDIERAMGSVGAFDAAVKLLGGGTVPEILILPSGNVITRDIIDNQSPPVNSNQSTPVEDTSG